MTEEENLKEKINACIWNFAERKGRNSDFRKRKKRIPDIAYLSEQAYKLLSKDNLLIEKKGEIHLNHPDASEIRAYIVNGATKNFFPEIVEEQKEYKTPITFVKFGIFKDKYKIYDLSLRVLDLCI